MLLDSAFSSSLTVKFSKLTLDYWEDSHEGSLVVDIDYWGHFNKPRKREGAGLSFNKKNREGLAINGASLSQEARPYLKSSISATPTVWKLYNEDKMLYVIGKIRSISSTKDELRTVLVEKKQHPFPNKKKGKGENGSLIILGNSYSIPIMS